MDDQYNIKQKFLIDLSNFKILRKLYSGAFGKVFAIKDKITNKEFAAKVLNSEEGNRLTKRMINREIEIMMYLKHPTIIQFHGYSLQDFEGKNNVTIIMDLAKNGSLDIAIQNSKKGLSNISYDNTARQKILIGIARGMMYLHKFHVIHRDLKPLNILLDDFFNPYICDFGLSKIYDFGRSLNQTQTYGTSIYMAPEVIEGNQYNEKADVYSKWQNVTFSI